MTGASELKMISYHVLLMKFELNEDFEFKKGKIDIRPTFKRDIQKIDESHFQVILGIEVSSEINNNPIPFNAEISISSVFELLDWESEISKTINTNNATAIMFPYLRTLLSTLTLNGNVPPYILPIMNINALFKNK